MLVCKFRPFQVNHSKSFQPEPEAARCSAAPASHQFYPLSECLPSWKPASRLDMSSEFPFPLLSSGKNEELILSPR